MVVIKIYLQRFLMRPQPLLLALALFSIQLSGQAEETPLPGKSLFATHCQTCHGVEGRGDGPAGKVLDPPPRDLTMRPYKQGCGPGAIVQTLRSGVSGSAMPSFQGVLNEQEMQELAKYVRSIQHGCRGCQGHQ
jgi:high-affinity iron transporter